MSFPFCPFSTHSVATDSDDSLVDASTAPSTPDGSLTFSPVWQASHKLEALEIGSATGIEPRLRALSTSLDLNTISVRAVKNICCVGAGYVGGPTSAVIAFQNPSIRVNVVDRDPARIASWRSKHLPIHEKGLGEIVRIARDGSNTITLYNGPPNAEDIYSFGCANDGQKNEITLPAREPNLFFTTEVARCISEADIILITVNTPTKSRGSGAGSATDMGALEGATREIALNARPGTILVEKSTVPCGTSELIKEMLSEYRPDTPFEVLSNPEFLAEGSAVKDLLHPDRVIIGSSMTPSGRAAADCLASVYSAWVPQDRITTVNIWSSELSKLVANAMLAQRISSINSISSICEAIGADISEIALSVGLDPRIGPQYLKSGLGFGGSCFKKDILSLIYLAEGLGLHAVGEYWRQVLVMNDFQRDRFAERVIRKLNNTLVRKKVTLLGYAFKKNTADTREAPALDVIKTLLKDAPGEIAIFDPCCNPETVKTEIQQSLGSRDNMLLKEDGGPVAVYTDIYEACQDSHAVVILTEWDEFRNSASAARSKRGSKTKITTQNKDDVTDPRPFQFPHVPGETEILNLHKYLISHSSGVPTSKVALFTKTINSDTNKEAKFDANNPLKRYKPEPTCAPDCRECTRLEDAYNKAGEQLDWVRVARQMRSPKWVFDGRGILDVPALEDLGFRCEVVGIKGR